MGQTKGLDPKDPGLSFYLPVFLNIPPDVHENKKKGMAILESATPF